MAQLDLENIWKIMKKIRISFLKRNLEPECERITPSLSEIYIQDIIDQFAEELNLTPSSIPKTPKDNITYQKLETAGQIFTYLMYCPPKLVPLVAQILKSETPKNMILALTSMIKRPTIVPQSSRKILINVLKTLKLDQYETIQIITKGKCYINGTFGNYKNNFNEEDLNLLGLFSALLSSSAPAAL